MIVIGITGTLGAGKNVIVDYFKTKNFYHYSAREYLIKIVKQKGLQVNRDTLTETANHCRETQGADFIAVGLLNEAKKDNKNCVIESIRNIKEVEYLRKNCDFILISVDADIKVRYERIKKRGSETDNVDYQTFVSNEQREMSSSDINKQNLQSVMTLADYKIINDSTIENLQRNMDTVYNEIINLHK